MQRLRRSTLFIVTALFFIGVGFALAITFVPELTGRTVGAIDDVEPPTISESDALSQRETIYNEIYQAVSPSVVSLTIATERGMNVQNVSSGSGFIVTDEGHIITNYHLVAVGGRIQVRTFDGTVAEATVIGTDPDSDLAVIQAQDIPSERLTPASFGDSEALNVGDTVLAIGNPFQNDWTLTTGIVSALNRSIRGLERFSIGGVIQTDTAINPGNSGGPLIDMEGNVIGVNSQIESSTRSNAGVGFAVPSNLVRKVADNLIATGEMSYSYLGVTAVAEGINLDLVETYELPNNLQGVPVIEVESGSPVAEAGIQDATEEAITIITAIDDNAVDNFSELIAYLALNTNPSDVVTLDIQRGGDARQVDVTLTDRPEGQQPSLPFPGQ